MKRSNQILWRLATLTLIAARGVVPCLADEPVKTKTPPPPAAQAVAGKTADAGQSVHSPSDLAAVETAPP